MDTTVLHLSDLHLHINSYEQEMSKFESLIRCVKNYLNINDLKYIDACVITGDIIDAQEELSENNQKYTSRQKWGNALKFFKKIIDEKIFKNLLIVPGNHDVTSSKTNFINYGNKNSCSIIDNKYATDNLYFRDFQEEFINIFIRELNDYKIGKDNINIEYTINANHRYIRINDIGFYLINSVYNYNKDAKEPLCIDCNFLNALIKSEGNKDDIHIAISHNPLINVCENVTQNSYGIEGAIDINSLISANEESFFNYNLAGHCHTTDLYRNDNGKLKVVDTRLYIDETECNLYLFKSKECKETSCSEMRIIYDMQNKNFKFVVGNDEKYKIFGLSKRELKTELFARDINLNAQDIINKSKIDGNNIIIGEQSFNIFELSEFYRYITNYRQVKDDSDKCYKKNISLKDIRDIFEKIINDSISFKKEHSLDSKPIVPITIKGGLGTGKSTFLNLLYWYILLSDKYVNYCPVYINLNNYIEDKDINVNKQQLENHITEIDNLKFVLNKKIIYLIDGFDNFKVNENLDQLVNSLSDKNSNILKSTSNDFYIFCVNRHFSSLLEPGEGENQSRDKNSYLYDFTDSKYILYFYRLSFTEDNEKIDLSAKRYLSLANGNASGNANGNIISILQNLKENGVFVYDCQLMHQFVKNITSDISQKMEDIKIDKLFNDGNLVDIAKKYLEGNLLSIDEYKKLTSQTEIEYAYALGYLNQLEITNNLSKYLLKQQNYDGYLPRYFNKQINYFVNLILNHPKHKSISNNIISQLKNISYKSYEDFNKISLAQFLYILRNNKFYKNNNVLSFINDLEGSIKEKKSDSESQDLIIKRVLRITKLSQHKFKDVYSFICELINNTSQRELNRKFDLFYYGDRESLEDKTDVQIYHTVYQQIYRLNNIVWKEIERYELSLFTLCSLVQQAITSLKFRRKSNSKHSPKCNTIKDYCKKLIRILDGYFKNTSISSQEHLIVYGYYKHIYNYCQYYLGDQKTKPILELIYTKGIKKVFEDGYMRNVLDDFYDNRILGKQKNNYFYQNAFTAVASELFLLPLDDKQRSVALTYSSVYDLFDYFDYCYLNTYENQAIIDSNGVLPNFVSHISYLSDEYFNNDNINLKTLVDLLYYIEISKNILTFKGKMNFNKDRISEIIKFFENALKIDLYKTGNFSSIGKQLHEYITQLQKVLK